MKRTAEPEASGLNGYASPSLRLEKTIKIVRNKMQLETISGGSCDSFPQPEAERSMSVVAGRHRFVPFGSAEDQQPPRLMHQSLAQCKYLLHLVEYF